MTEKQDEREDTAPETAKKEASLPPFRHEDASLLISRAWDGDITPDEAKWLAEHLRGCAECARASRELIDLLSRLEAPLRRAAEDEAATQKKSG